MRITTYFILFIALFYGSCKSFLDEDPKGFLAPGNTYTSTDGFEIGINGLHSYARQEYSTWTEGEIITHGANPYESLQVGTDICITGLGDATLVPFENYTLHNASSYVKSFWKYSYGLIGNANLILEASENPDVKWDNPAADKARVQAIARFFRAYAYRYLVYLYGDVPWVEKVERNTRTDFTRTPKAEVLEHMIEDLRFAADNLTENADGVKEGELTKWAALHLLAEVYLMDGNPTDAKQAALDVIGSNQYNLMDTRFGTQKSQAGDPFSDLFKEGNQDRRVGNREVIWAMQLQFQTQGGGDRYMDWSKRAWVPYYSNVPGFVLADSLGGRGLGQIVPLDWWLNGYEAVDMRNSAYNIKRDWYYNDPKGEHYGEKVAITADQRDKGLLFATTTKFFYGKTELDPAYEGNNKDRVKSRLAETYLLLAEAQLGLQDPGGAAISINKIRERAGARPVTAADITVDFLLDERARELLGEEVRRFTLARFGADVFEERVKRLNPRSATAFKKTNVLWPIPQEVIDANSDAEFPQNLGY